MIKFLISEGTALFCKFQMIDRAAAGRKLHPRMIRRVIIFSLHCHRVTQKCLLHRQFIQNLPISSQLSKNMSSKISAVSTKNAPAALSVYSQAIVANGFVYCSGT
jgi:hypothetical protein